jgi:hypothetical protein
MGLFDKVFGQKIAEEITPSCDDEYNALLNECVAEVTHKNQKLADEYGLGSYERWDINQEIGELVFSDGGVPQLVCSVTMLGSFSEQSETWMWGWANPSLLEPLTRDTNALRDYGEQHRIEDLVVGKTTATEGDAWALSALSCRILDGLGLYRGPTGNGFVVMMLKEIKPSEQASSSNGG